MALSIKLIEIEIENLEVGIAHSNPILRGYEPLSTLAGDSGSGVIKAKVMSLLDSHPFWCKVRGDGNCFYRAAALGLLVFGLSPQSPTGFFRALIGRLRATQALPEVAPVSLAMDITAAFLESLSSGWLSDGTASTTRLISEIAGDPKLDAAIVTRGTSLTFLFIRIPSPCASRNSGNSFRNSENSHRFPIGIPIYR